MSQSQIKPIKINPELFNISSRGKKNKTLKKGNTITDIKPNKLKNELLTKIKNYRHKQNTPSLPVKLDNISSQQSQQSQQSQIVLSAPIKKSSTMKTLDHSNDDDDDFSQSINFLKDLSSKNKKKQKNNEDSFPLSLASNKEDIVPSQSAPPYSCLKNSSLPTFREWKNKTLKKSADEKSDNQNFLNVSMDTMQTNELPPQLQQVTDKGKTFKYYLGKKGKKVAILIKNSHTRKKIIREHDTLKQTSIGDMKKYLKRHNLLKSGSYAPPDVIKKMYEQALLGGDIRNSNKTNIIHNYLAE